MEVGQKPSYEATRLSRPTSTPRVQSAPAKVDTSEFFASALEDYFTGFIFDFRASSLRPHPPRPLPPSETAVPPFRRRKVIIEGQTFYITRMQGQRRYPIGPDHAPIPVRPSLQDVAEFLWRSTIKKHYYDDRSNLLRNIKKLAWLMDLFDQPKLPLRMLPTSPPNGYSERLWNAVLESTTRGLLNRARMMCTRYKKLLGNLPKWMRRLPRERRTLGRKEDVLRQPPRPITIEEVKKLVYCMAYDYFQAIKYEGKGKSAPPLRDLLSGYDYRLAACNLIDRKAVFHARCVQKCIVALFKSGRSLSPWEQLECTVRRMVFHRFKFLLHLRRRRPNENFSAVLLNIPAPNISYPATEQPSNVAAISTHSPDSVTVLPSSDASTYDTRHPPSTINTPRPPTTIQFNDHIPAPPAANGLCIGSWNPGTLADGKVIDAVEFMAHHGLHALAVQETRLRGDNQRPPDLHRSYDFLGRARPTNAQSRSNNHGGGVGWIIHKSLRPTFVTGMGGTDEGCERVWIRLETNAGPLFMASVYWRPGSLMKKTAVSKLIDEVAELSQRGHVLLAGDFNGEYLPPRPTPSPPPPPQPSNFPSSSLSPSNPPSHPVLLPPTGSPSSIAQRRTPPLRIIPSTSSSSSPESSPPDTRLSSLPPPPSGFASSSSSSLSGSASHSTTFCSFLIDTSLRNITDPSIPTHRLNADRRPTAIDHILASSTLLAHAHEILYRAPPTDGIWLGHWPIAVTLRGIQPIAGGNRSQRPADMLPTRFRSSLLEKRTKRQAFQRAVEDELRKRLPPPPPPSSSSSSSSSHLDIEQKAQALHDAVVQAAIHTLDFARRHDDRPYRRGFAWWTDGLTDLLKERHERRRYWLGKRPPSPKSPIPRRLLLEAYRAEEKKFAKQWRNAVRRAKRAYWRHVVGELNREEYNRPLDGEEESDDDDYEEDEGDSDGRHGQLRRLFGLARALTRTQATPAGRAPPRHYFVDDATMAEYWQSVWNKRDLPDEALIQDAISSALRTFTEHPMDVDRDNDDDDDDPLTSALLAPVTTAEVKANALKLAKGKAPDYHGIDNEILSNLPDVAYELLADIINTLLHQPLTTTATTDTAAAAAAPSLRSYPACWRHGRLVFLPKDASSAEALSNPANYRPITLLSGFFRLTEKVLWTRLRPWAEAHGLFHPSQAGFRIGRSTVAQTLPLHILRQYCEKTNTQMTVVLLDVTKAFDSISHDGVLAKLLEGGVPVNVALMIRILLDGHVNHFGSAPYDDDDDHPDGQGEGVDDDANANANANVVTPGNGHHRLGQTTHRSCQQGQQKQRQQRHQATSQPSLADISSPHHQHYDHPRQQLPQEQQQQRRIQPPSIVVGRGAPQGSVLGPFAFSCYFTLPQVLENFAAQQERLRRMEALPQGFPYRVPAWADDTAIVASNDKDAQTLLDECVRWGHAHGLTFNAKKSVALRLGTRKVPLYPTLKLRTFGDDDVGRHHGPVGGGRGDGDLIWFKNAAKHLGVLLTTHSKIRRVPRGGGTSNKNRNRQRNEEEEDDDGSIHDDVGNLFGDDDDYDEEDDGPHLSPAKQETLALFEKVERKINAMSSLLLARQYGLNASLSMRLVASTILPMLLYGSELLSLKENSDVEYIEKCQVLMNKALRKVLNAYARTHRTQLHFFTGSWRMGAHVKYRRLMALARWHAFPEHNGMAMQALEFAKNHQLPFHLENEALIQELGLPEDWKKFIESLEEANREQQQERDPLRAWKLKKGALTTWKRATRTKIDEIEASWNRSDIPIEFVIKKRCLPSPYLEHPLANFGFLRLVDIFDPPDVVARQGGVVRPCYLCGAEGGDRFSHLLNGCGNIEVTKLRQLYSRYMGYVQHLETFAQAWRWRKGCGGSEGLAAKASDVELVKELEVNPLKVDNVLKLLKKMYNLRKRARYEAMRRERAENASRGVATR